MVLFMAQGAGFMALLVLGFVSCVETETTIRRCSLYFDRRTALRTS
jgi:hypothetical protein